MKYLFLLFVFLLINTNLLASNQYFVYDSISHEVILKKQVDTTIKLSDFFDLYLLNEQENFNDNLIFDSSFNSRFQPYQIFKKLKTNEFSRKKMWGRIKLVNELNESQELILYFSNSDTTYFFEVRRNKLINTKFRVSETKNNLDIYRPGDNYKIYLLPKDTVIYYLKNYSGNFWYYSDVSSLKFVYKNDIIDRNTDIFILTMIFCTIIYVIIFGFNTKEKIYLYYLLYILSLFTFLFHFLGIDFYFFEKPLFNNSFLSYSQFQLIFFDLIFVFSILFLKNFLNAGLYFKKWNKYYNYSIYYGLFLFIFIPFNIQRDSNFSYIWGISFSILYPLFALSITSMIIIAYKLLKNRLQKSAVFVLIGWLPIFFITILVPIIITFYEKFFMVGFNETLAVFFRYGIVTIFLFEMYVFFFGISYQSRLNKKELEKKKIENQRLEFEKEFELKEKELTEKLLLNVLPESIASRLKSGETTIADLFNEASVIFIDIANFTKYSSRTNPEELVKELNRIYTIFDGISTKHGVEKIKTIGDCYMAAAGIPLPKENHAEAIALMAFEILETMNGYKTADGTEIKFRIGIDSGQIVAGIIGEQKFIYDLWGDTVNTASRMEEYGEIGKIQCTQEFKDLFTIQSKSDESSKIIDYYFEKRGEIEIKGKGMMTTWFLKTYIE